MWFEETVVPSQPRLDLSPKVSSEVRKTTCYMCACRCGINVHMKNGKAVYIEGNRDHPVNQGVLCAKGSAGIMQHNAPSRLRAPLKRVGPRGSGEFQEISWDAALELAVSWLTPLRKTAPEKLAFFTGRDQSQSFTSFWAQNFGTPNYAAHGGFCSVNMAAAGIYTMGGSFWEFGQPDWDHTRLFMLFGVAEDHDSNPIKMGLGRIKARGAKVIGVNPIRTGYNAIADEWVGITPGTDGLFILSLIQVLLQAGKIDLSYLARYTNAPALIIDNPGAADDGLLLKDVDGKVIVIDRTTGRLTPFDKPGVRPDLNGTFVQNGQTYRTVMHKMAETYLVPDYAPEAVAEHCGISAQKIRAIAAELARVAFDEAFELPVKWTDFRGETHNTMTGRPVSFHAMRGISAHANGFQTCRALHILQILLGTVETPGGFRFKPPYPKPVEAHPKPHHNVQPGFPLDGPHLGFVRGPEDLALKDDGTPTRIDKAFTWENPMSVHGLMHMVISNAHAGDPYKIDTLFMYMANMSWNSTMNTRGVMDMLTDKDGDGNYIIPHIIYSDAYSSEMVAYADLILPDTTYLERHDCISLLDRPICEAAAAADAIRWPVVEPDRDVRGFQTTLVHLANKMKLPGFTNQDGSAKYADYADYIINHQRKPGIGPLAGWRLADEDSGEGASRDTAAGRGSPNPEQLDRYIENGGFFMAHIPEDATYYKPWNTAYQDWAVNLGLYDSPQPYLFQLYCEPLRRFQLAAEGHGPRQPPEHLKSRFREQLTPLPICDKTNQTGNDDFPITALTQRPMAMYHSWGTQNAWLRQIHGCNPLYVPTKVMREHGLQDGDWARVTSSHGEITVPVMEMAALNGNTVWTWNAIGKRKGAWALDENAPEATRGFLLNHLIHELLPPKGDGLRWTNSDPITGQAAWFDLRVNIEKADRLTEAKPAFGPLQSPVPDAPKKLAWGPGE
ncbi:MAG: molybdopterin oxidoreductase family protein [Rhodobacteraceae bacterium]|nr:molybdopterin oxidoreductase family protein [Paracoccaceae bacterium]